MSYSLQTLLTRDDVRSRRAAAVHEAGHVVIARYYDVCCFKWQIERGENGWRGCTTLIRRISPRKELRTSVAGAVAQALWFNDRVDLGALSPSDWEDTGIDPCRRSVEDNIRLFHAILDVQRILRRNGHWWSLLLEEARNLIDYGDSRAACAALVEELREQLQRPVHAAP